MAKRRSYTKEEREAVVADVPALGVTEAARKHGVPQTNVTHWARVAGVGREGKPSPTATRRPKAKARKSKVAASPKRARKGRSAGKTRREQPVAARSEREPKAKTGKSKGAARPKHKKERAGHEPPTAGPSDAKEPSAGRSKSEATAGASAQPPGRRTLKIRVAKIYTPSQKGEILEHAATHGITEASKKFGVSRFSIYGWQRKVNNAAQGEGPSPTAGPGPKDLEAQRDKEILDEWHRHPGLGPSQIRNQLRRKGIRTSVNTIRRVMEGAGYRTPKVERKPHDQRYEATRPNHLWHLDFVQRNIHRANTFTLILIDDFSRYVVGHGVDEGAERADFVIAAFEQAVARHGRPEMVMHDKGAAFWSWKGVSRFTALLTELGIDQIEAQHKEWNGKVEVFNANLHKELFDAHRFYDLAEMRRRLATHLDWYNHARTHHALGGLLVPADRYYGRVGEVLARIEAGAGRDPSDLLDLRERCLELFKVTSKGGVAEVWLLGQRLLEMPAAARS
jgi:putative transposase